MANMVEEVSIWEKARTVSTLVASIFIPLVVVAITQMYTRADAQRQREARYVELAIEILREKPRDETQAIRNWAIEIMNNYSPVKLPARVLEELKVEPIHIQSALDGNMKSSAKLLEDIEKTLKEWERLVRASENLKERLREEAKPPIKQTGQ